MSQRRLKGGSFEYLYNEYKYLKDKEKRDIRKSIEDIEKAKHLEFVRKTTLAEREARVHAMDRKWELGKRLADDGSFEKSPGLRDVKETSVGLCQMPNRKAFDN